MKRKINLVGKNTLTISLPSKWAKNHGIKKGDELELEEHKVGLLLSKSLVAPDKKEIDINLPVMEGRSLEFFIRELYIEGYFTITLRFKQSTIIHSRLKKEMTMLDQINMELQRLMGLEIVHTGKDFCILKCLTRTSIDEFEVSMKRIFLILSEIMKEIENAIINGNRNLLQYGVDMHDQVTRLIVYNLRTLNNIGYKDKTTTMKIFSLLYKIDDIIDNTKYWIKEIHSDIPFKKKPMIRLINRFTELFLSLYDDFYKYDLAKISDFFEIRYKYQEDLLKYKLSKACSQPERRCTSYMEQLIEELTKLKVAIMALKGS